DLEPPICCSRLTSKEGKDLTNRNNVLVSQREPFIFDLICRPLWKIYLAWLIVNQQTRHGMVRFSKETFLQRERSSNVVSEPIRTAAYLPEVVITAAADYFHGQVSYDQPKGRVRPFCIQERYQLTGRVLNCPQSIAELSLYFRFRDDIL